MRSKNDTIYAPYWQLIDDTKVPVRDALDLTQTDVDTASFGLYNNYADTIRSIQFDGIPFVDEFTDDTWLEMLEIQKAYLMEWFSFETRALMVSRMMRKPLAIMESKVFELLGLTDAQSDLTDAEKRIKYMIYSAHDTQVDNVEVWLNPDDYDMEFIKFASTIFFELKYSESCLASTPSTTCFWVEMFYNNFPLSFAGFCGTKCSFDDFQLLMADRWYKGLNDDDLNLACAQEYHF